MNMTKKEKKEQREELLGFCNKLGITVSEKAHTKTLKRVLHQYYEDAVVVNTGDGLHFSHERGLANIHEYFFDVDFKLRVSINAESGREALEWLDENFFSVIGIGYGIRPVCSFLNFYRRKIISIRIEEDRQIWEELLKEYEIKEKLEVL